MFSENEQKWLINLAKNTINAKLNNEKVIIPNEKDVLAPFVEKNGTFVTLKKNGDLRGCIGYIFPQNKIYIDIIDNSINAAFKDPRFNPLQKKELNEIDLEISILTQPKELYYENTEDLLNKLDSSMGIILKKNFRSATFLPQVWEQLPDKIDFLSHLAHKAGLSVNDWKTATFLYYNVIHFGEKF